MFGIVVLLQNQFGEMPPHLEAFLLYSISPCLRKTFAQYYTTVNSTQQNSK